MVTIPDRTGVVLVDTNGVPYKVTSSGGVSQQDNSAFTAGTDSGAPIEGLYEATPSTITDGRVGVVGITSDRQLKVVPAGNVAHDAVDSGNPILFGGRAESVSSRAAVSTGDRVIASHDIYGRYNVALGGNNGTAAGDGATTVTVPYQAGVGDVNTTRPLIVAGFMYNGSSWDRVRGTTTGGLTVSGSGTAGTAATGVQTIQGIASMTPVQVGDNSASLSVDWNGTQPVTGSGNATGALRVELANNGTGVLGTVGTVTTVTTLTGTTTLTPGTGASNLGKAEDAAHTTGDVGVMALGVRAASPTERSAGPTDGDYEPFATNEVGAVWTSLTPSVNGGLSTFMASGSDGSSILVATAQAVKASAGALYGYYAYNPEAAVTFVHFYNTAAASVTVGTTNPLFSFAIPAGSAANLTFPMGVIFSNAGWSVAATTTAGGNSAPATGVSLVAWYK